MDKRSDSRGLYDTYGIEWTEATWNPLFVPESLSIPLRTKKPTTFFVNSMSDLWFEGFTNDQIAAVFCVMAACPQHTFQVLTKRAARMRDWFRWVLDRGNLFSETLAAHPEECLRDLSQDTTERPWPLPNVWLGVSSL